MNEITRKSKDKILFIYSILLVSLLLIAVNIDNPIFLWILFGATSLLILKPIFIIPVYIISSLSSTYFVLGEGLGISRIIGFILILSGLIYISRNKIIINKKNAFYLLLLTIFILLSSIFSLRLSLHSFILFVQYFTIVFIFSQIRNLDLTILTNLLVLSSIVTIAVIGITLKDSIMEIEYYRLTTGDYVNANRFAMMLAQLCAITFAAILIYKKKKLYLILLIVAILSAFYMILLSGSRASFVGITLAIFVVSLITLKRETKRFIIPFALIVILSFVFWDQIQQMDIPIINRFTVEGIKDSGGSQTRFIIWRTLIPTTLTNKPLFGYGFGAENVITLANRYGLDKPAHNFLIDMFIQIGIIGTILFFSYFFFVAGRLKENLHEPQILIPILILFTALFNGIGETVFSEKLFWNGIALAWLYTNNIKKQISPIK